jgi:hypothetical protein
MSAGRSGDGLLARLARAVLRIAPKSPAKLAPWLDSKLREQHYSVAVKSWMPTCPVIPAA